MCITYQWRFCFRKKISILDTGNCEKRFQFFIAPFSIQFFIFIVALVGLCYPRFSRTKENGRQLPRIVDGLPFVTAQLVNFRRGRPLLWLPFFFTIPHQAAGYKGEIFRLAGASNQTLERYPLFLYPMLLFILCLQVVKQGNVGQFSLQSSLSRMLVLSLRCFCFCIKAIEGRRYVYLVN